MKKQANQPLPPLTAKEKSVLQFIEQELVSKGVSPSYQEICDHFGFASFNSVQNYLKQLSNKGYVLIPQNQKRAIQILHSADDFQKDLANRLNIVKEPSKNSFAGQSSQSSQSDNSKVLPIPFLGRVAAGSPIERLHENEFIDVPATFIKTPGDYFALKVEGDSMIDEGIFDGDFLVVLSQKNAKDGDLVVASVETESTVKRFYMKKNPEISTITKAVELRPANPRLTSMWYAPQQVEIKGLVKALLRKY
ncbi:transcriptional repressor LexA [Pseudobdellovibrio sp. HCB154]|uniref:transcriptional repressor LexA n=1 Tax=Pseudobdellovibrio sp. HCB154 TaxID=3386277 RepID=UPI00391717CC